MKYEEGENLLCSQCLKSRQALKKGDNGSKYFICAGSSLQTQTKASQYSCKLYQPQTWTFPTTLWEGLLTFEFLKKKVSLEKPVDFIIG